MFFFFSNRGEDEEEETKQLLEFDAGSSFVNVVAVWLGDKENSNPFSAASLTIIEVSYGRPMFSIL
jgi:hypothetical protein